MILDGNSQTWEQLIDEVISPTKLTLTKDAWEKIRASRDLVERRIANGDTIYGINTGFGKLANKRIKVEELSQLQVNLLRSHATGVGDFLPESIVRLIYILKINSFARGYSGIREVVVRQLITFYDKGIIPAIPEKGSVGASGDLAPLAHFSLPLIGEGYVVDFQGQKIPAKPFMETHQLEPLQLEAKEGLSLINGTQVTTALTLMGLSKAWNLHYSNIGIGAFSTEVMLGTDTSFRKEIQEARNQKGQKHVAELYYSILQDSGFRRSHESCNRVQDFYSLRCQTQVNGSVHSILEYASSIINAEINSVTDNPLTIVETDEVLSGGNFHAAPIAHIADFIAIVLTDMLAMSERRISAFQDTNQSQLPMFLTANAGLNSGFMIAHVTAAALASENKMYAHPASIDTIPTSANQEDHVSMGPNAARKLLKIIENGCDILGIELSACMQAAHLNHHLHLSPITQHMFDLLKDSQGLIKDDVYLGDFIQNASSKVADGKIAEIVKSI
jgi:histidine ammonia-lyase